ncbi:hypothetical protein [Celeribacter baekdonensis]|uniref:Uncharacterized protein n=1 Tax=Celeribacter baekdonensis TaxID=875171 RepID=A0A2R4M0Q3_9RHOB|nr:hypothetical protein [Celeribacter baekdonensis]AVW90697.1 hypothetical protein DA792_05985 [Celeribacter baekdonensis]
MLSLWPFPVRQPVTEVLEWNTDTLITEAAEQRIALRTVPRSILTVSHLLDASDLSRAAELARAGPLDDWTVPLWHLARPSTVPVDAADITVFVDTGEGAFEAPGQAVIAADGGVAYLVEVSAVLPDWLELAAPAGVTLAHPIVAPVGTGILTRPIEIDRRRQGLGTVTATFTLQTGTDLSASSYATHLGLDVLTDPAVLRQPLAESIAQSVEYIDNGFGPIVIEPVLTHVQRRSTITLIDRGAGRWSRRRWLYSLRGRQRAFWLPTWGRELVLQAAVTSSATSVIIVENMDPGVLIGRHVMFEIVSGPVFCEITNAVYDALGIRLTIAAPGKSIPITTPIHLLTKFRLDTDRIEIEHFAGRTEFAASLIEIPG